MSKYLVKRANALIFGVLVIVLLMVTGLTWDRLNESRAARDLVGHTYNVLGAIKDLNLAVRHAETGQRGFLLTGDPRYLTPYQASIEQVSLIEGTLQGLTIDSPAEQDRVRKLGPIIQRKLEELAQTIQLRRTLGLNAALKLVETDAGRQNMTQIEDLLAAMTAKEKSLLEDRLAATDDQGAVARWLSLAATALALLALVWAARLLNRAWTRSEAAEKDQRMVAQRLRASLDSLSQGVAVFDASYTLINWNDCFQVLLQLPKPLLRRGMEYAAFVEQTAQNGVSLLESADQVRHCGANQDEVVVYERIRGDGSTFEIRRTKMPGAGFVLAVSDLTKRVQAEAVLREAQKMQAIGQLTGGIAHDFNNLLTVILGNLEFIRSKLKGDEALETRVDRASWAAQRGATLTAQLLAFARRQPLAPEPINLAATMPDIIPLLRRSLGEHIDVRYVETAGLWPAMADASQLESALLNLALNARDAMPGGGQLTIELANKVLDRDYALSHTEVLAGDYAMLAVSDTGHGMPTDVAARVFEPFFTTKPDGKGTGLGLAMVFGFVKQSGGHIKIYSEVGEGTTVRLYLPRALVGASVLGRRSASPMDLPRGSATILVVEDESSVREIATAILRELGYRVLEAADGEEALHVFGTQATNIDLLITDVVLAGKMKGREVAERINAIRPDIPVLYMSGYTENSIVHQGRLDEGVHLLGKPFSREQLARKVVDVLGLRISANRDDSDKVVELKPRREG